jgi:hypothetical protein
MGKGQVAGKSLQFNHSYCDGRFQLIDGAILKGVIGCGEKFEGQYVGNINLQ